MNRRIQIVVSSRPPAGLPGTYPALSFWHRFKLLISLTAIALVLVSVLIAALVLGFVFAAILGTVLEAMIVAVLIKTVLRRIRSSE